MATVILVILMMVILLVMLWLVMMTVALVMVMLVIVVQLVMAMEALVMVGVTEEPNRAYYCSSSLDGFFTGRAFSHCISPDPAIARLHCVLQGSSLSYIVEYCKTC